MKKLLIVFTLLNLFSCGIARASYKEKKIDSSASSYILFPDSLLLIVSSANLSEDMSTLSSNDDEDIILIYPYTDSAIADKPIFSKSFVLTKNKMSDTLHCYELKNMIHKKLILFLLERDTDKTLTQLEPSVRIHAKELLKAYFKKDYLEIEKYIGDDDILGIKIIDNFNRNTEIEFNDIYKMDRFSYQIKIR